MSTSSLLDALRSYWELPAVAHFCSLFRSVFNLVDFDIEDLEDGLIIDTESSADGGRSSLIVDILVSLLHGLANKRRVSLLNYNQRLHEVLGTLWVSAGLGPNPLGIDRENANFHRLPLYPKLKLLHCLCEWRLEKPDVETLIKDFSGDSLRVLPLGSDRNGLTYWYFYGTRLFCEEEELKIKISASYLSSIGGKNLKAEDCGGNLKEENMDTTLPSSVETPWDQPLLKAPEKTRWKLICSTMEEWKQLAEKYENSRSEKEQSLYRVLIDDFLPAIETLFVEIEKERMRKMAELAPRRSSDRLEYRKLKKEQEDRILAEREAVEMERVTKLEQEKQRRLAAEQREQRAKLRQLERDKRQLLRSKAREERSQRLEMRKMRQEMLLQGKEIPVHLLNNANDMMNDDELEELDREIEMEHMYGQLEKMVDALKVHPDAEPFLEPVSEDVAPDYKDVIANPMDLETLEDKLMERKYASKKEFIEDVNLILLNCLQYNGIYSEYVKTAIKFERTFIKAYKKYFPPTEVCAHSERARQEELDCISIMGTLDKRVKEMIAEMAVEAEAEEEQKRAEEAEKRAEQRTRAKWPKRKMESGNSESPSTALMEASSSLNAGGQIFAVSSKNDQLTRYCQFVDEDGLPADLKLIERALPLLKQMLHDFPKKVSTVMISLDKLDNITLTRVELSKTSGPPRKAMSPATCVSSAVQRTQAQTLPSAIAQNFLPRSTNVQIAKPSMTSATMNNRPFSTFNRVIIPSIDNDREALALPQPGTSTSFNAFDNYSLPPNRSTVNNAASSFQSNVPVSGGYRFSHQKPVCSVAPQRQMADTFSSPPVLQAMQQPPRPTTTSVVQQTQQHQRFVTVPPSTQTIIVAQGQPLLVVNQHPATVVPAVQLHNAPLGQSPPVLAPKIVRSTAPLPPPPTSSPAAMIHSRPQQSTSGQQPTRLKLTPNALAALGRVLAQQKNQPGKIQISIRSDSGIQIPKDSSQNSNN